MNQETKNNFIKAGKISAEVLEYGKSLIKKGNSLLEATEKIEKKIFELGAKPAFPVQISCDHIAAHYCPLQDDSVIFENQVVSLDIGVHINGAVGDNAYTIDLSGRYGDLVEAAQKALAEAIKIIHVGTKLREVGKAIQEAVSNYGFAPIRNLSGHGLGVYEVHKKPTIPNYDNNDETAIESGMVFAVEPFSTNGAGIVQNGGNSTVFELQKKISVRNPITRNVLKEIENFEGLPFTTRWLTGKLGQQAIIGLRELIRLGSLKEHPPLVEVNKGIVAQAEHSVLVDNDKVIILTRK